MDPTLPATQRSTASWFNTAAFVQPVYQFGTVGRNTITGAGLTNIDATIARTFHIFEKLKLQFRAEMFNVLNHPNFADPTGSLFSSEFGYSTGMLAQDLGRGGVNGGLNPLYQVGGPRSIQLALRVVF